MSLKNTSTGPSDGKSRPLALVVDDEFANRNIVSEFLKVLGFDVITASDGEEGWTRYIEHLPKLVVSDLNMPRKDGIVLLSQIKKHNKDQVFFLITGYYDRDQWDGSTEIVPDACLSKPFTITDLQNSITAAFGHNLGD